MKKQLLLVAGFLSLALGMVGIVLPLMPTAPFVILAAVCFSKSSPKVHRWLREHSLFGVYVRGYLEGQGIPRRAKLLAIIPLWTVMTISAVFLVDDLWLRVLLLGIAVGVTIHILRVPSPPAERTPLPEREPEGAM